MNLNLNRLFSTEEPFKAYLRWGLVLLMANFSLGCSWHASQLKQDETVQFFRTSALFDAVEGVWHRPIHAWVYEPEDSVVRKKIAASALKAKYGLELTDGTQTNFDRRLNLLISDNERGKVLTVEVGNKTFTLAKTDPRGHVRDVVVLPGDAIEPFVSGPEGSSIRYQLVLSEGDDRKFNGESLVVGEQGLSVISDIDDTVKISHVRDRKKLMDQTFFQDFEAVPGMSALYSQLKKWGIPVHFVSSSPWHLYQPLDEFLLKEGFPPSTYSLKTIRFKDSSLLNLFKKGDVTKPAQIFPILNQYPKRKFILIGDSGEQDPEVYEKIATGHPQQVVAVYIRNVSNESASDTRYHNLVKALADRFLLFDQADQVEQHFRALGLISSLD